MAEIVYALESVRLHDKDGLSYAIVRNEPWAADDPLVRLHPTFFGAEPVQVKRTQHPVEQATSAPGEKRKRFG